MRVRRTPEQDLLVACAQCGAVEERRRRIEAALELAPQANLTASLARSHGLLPLVAAALDRGELNAEAIDPGGEIRAAARRFGYQSVLLSGELIRLLNRLEAAGVAALPFKGPTLAAAAFGSPALRQYVDLDLLVRHEKFSAASSALVGMGYIPRQDPWSAVRHLSHERTFDGRDGRVEIDLHRRAFSRELPEIPEDELWERLDQVRLGEADVPTIRPEWLLVMLAEHAHKHLWIRIGWIADMAHLIAARPSLDWDELLANARRVGGRRVLGVGLTLAAGLLSAPLPTPIATRIASDAATCALAAEIEADLFVRHADEDAARLDLGALQWRSRERWRDRLRFALTPNEDDWLVLPLPAALFPVYYVIRPFRVAAKYGARWMRGRRRQAGVNRRSGSGG